jgi:hypothetical protein
MTPKKNYYGDLSVFAGRVRVALRCNKRCPARLGVEAIFQRVDGGLCGELGRGSAGGVGQVSLVTRLTGDVKVELLGVIAVRRCCSKQLTDRGAR